VSSVSNGLYFLTLPLVSVMRIIYTSKEMSKKFGVRMFSIEKYGTFLLQIYEVCIIFTPHCYFVACTCFQALNLRSSIYNFPVYSTLRIGTVFCIVPFVLTNAVLHVNCTEVFMGSQLCQDGLNIPYFQNLSMSVIKH
jgi:hypothetical protein